MPITAGPDRPTRSENVLDVFFERLIVRAATIDEILSDAFEALPGQKDDADLAARRLAAWCRSCASGDWSLFARRLDRDGLSIPRVLERFATVRRRPSAALPDWIEDAIWIDAALHSTINDIVPNAGIDETSPYAFEELFTPVVEHADRSLWLGLSARAAKNLNEDARNDLRRLLLRELSNLSTPALYERFVKIRNTAGSPSDKGGPHQRTGKTLYDQFVSDMKAGGFRQLFEDKPILLRLVASVTRQWIDTSRQFVERLDADLTAIRRDILQSDSAARVSKIEGDLSDPHNGGHSVLIVSFEDGTRTVYKPKDLRIDVAWHALIERLNRANPPLDLKAPRAIARDAYGWTEFIGHAEYIERDGSARFFRRDGAWLALFHCFAATDMHQENMIATGDQPVPIDLEMILQPTAEEYKTRDVEGEAHDAAMDIVANSVMTVGLLPAYGRSPDNDVFAMGGMTSGWKSQTKLKWNDINSDSMRPTKSVEPVKINPNLPHAGGHYAKFADHVEAFVSGFEDYAQFLLRLSRNANLGGLFDGFAGLPVRKIIRPTRFYYMLVQRLKNQRTMDDGITWSAQADFIARLAEWEKDSDPLWPLQRAERDALVSLNVPHFTSPSDGTAINDAAGLSVSTEAVAGLERAEARMRDFDAKDIAWQVEVIRENTNSILQAVRPPFARDSEKTTARAGNPVRPAKDAFIAEADRIAAKISQYAIRRKASAAWIGFDWLGDSEVFQLVCLGPELYNGVSGIAVFLAAHAAATGSEPSRELALAGISHLRKSLKSRTAARMARALGIGGAIGLGSIVYALAVISKCLKSDELLADARTAAQLFTDDLIAADKQLDVIGGSAGAILGLLRLYRDTKSHDVLMRAAKCGEHLLAQSRLGPEGRRTWVGQGSGTHGLNGMSHGAAGFACALSALSAATGREEFAQAATECLAFENSSYDTAHHNWPDLRGDDGPNWPCQWCHGAPGIGLARLAMIRNGHTEAKALATDVRNAVAGVTQSASSPLDTLCCGTLGRIEFLCEAGDVLKNSDLREGASAQLAAMLELAASQGDYRWNSGKGQFNLGLFRGLAGVGYTLMRQVDGSLPNVLIWE